MRRNLIGAAIATGVVALGPCGLQSPALSASGALQPAGSGKVLFAPDLAAHPQEESGYPRLVRLEHSGAADGTLLAIFTHAGGNVSPEAAVGGGLALLRTGDRIRVDLGAARVNVLLSDAELDERRQDLAAQGGYAIPASQTPWQEIQRATVGQLGTGAVLEPAVKYQDLAGTVGVPRHSH